MTSTALTTQVESDEAVPVNDILNRARSVHEVMTRAMKPGMHYGVIPGCKEPSLWKPGAEKIAMLFGISVDKETIEERLSSTEVHYRVRATAKSASGREMGSSEAACGTAEKKYRWRRPVCQEEYDEAPAAEKRTSWGVEWYGQGRDRRKRGVKIFSVRIDVGDVIHTCLSIAQKRAYVALIRECTAASDIFAPVDHADRGDTDALESDAPADISGAGEALAAARGPASKRPAAISVSDMAVAYEQCPDEGAFKRLEATRQQGWSLLGKSEQQVLKTSVDAARARILGPAPATNTTQDQPPA